MKRYCLTLDLKDDQNLIEEYRQYHQQVWPEVLSSIRESGIKRMEIYHVQTRLFMIMETSDDFSFEQKNKLDQANATVQKWERLMDEYQQRLPFAKPEEKWVLMEKIFEL